MRNPFRIKKQRQTWEGRPRGLTLDDPVFKDWDKEDIQIQPKERKSDGDIQRKPIRNDGVDGTRYASDDSGHYYNHNTTLGYASIAGVLSGDAAQNTMDSSSADCGSAGSAGGDGSGGQ
ncbi:uncharacterized protein CTRU02_214428 [Colletotrichum truncatum]|uniref:Uncharacterized protein n=1 Tax=Colletotrichum truncatum TaxID=5467 RepID=A0ACC3YER9_COLTU|nr:uncharacterized protein CTRU02_13467 [Colletotrichum truncatum]KAF6783231.1 hypothetical protein CTRU02_13467 [Colletotrichum truncatum]